MPVIITSSYKAAPFLRNGHISTMYPHLFRRIRDVKYVRERIDTDDGDFLDLDWSRQGNDRLAIISHGLEGSTNRDYVLGMVRALNKNGWDALAWNFRSCSGEINRQLKFYHNGATEDLDQVIQYAIGSGTYKSVDLVGFSMGGNLSLVYLGQKGPQLDQLIKRAVVFSVPCNLTDSSIELARPLNKIYMIRFLKKLQKKVQGKKKQFPDKIDDSNYHRIKNFKDFDDRYTAPIHGFKDAADYWQKCSSDQFIKNIQIPTLIVNAQDDPFLGGNCFPEKEAEDSSVVFLEMPAHGGHVGFATLNNGGAYWSEDRAVEFLSQKLRIHV